MKQHVITADIYAHWGSTHPKYRVYVDGDLLTERDFTWPGHEIYIQENIVVNLMPGKHCLTIEPLESRAKIQVKNITVDGIVTTADFITE